MVVEDQIQLMSQRIGGQRLEALLSTLDDCGSAGDALRLLRSSEFFRGLVERQIDWLETEAQFKARHDRLHHRSARVLGRDLATHGGYADVIAPSAEAAGDAAHSMAQFHAAGHGSG